MPISSTSYQFSAAYGTSVTWRHETPASTSVKPEDVENSKSSMPNISDTLQMGRWEDLWTVKATETANEDGTVTQTVSGGINFFMVHKDGCTASGRTGFQVSAAFDPATYEAGQLTSTVDLMTAAYAASKAAFQETFSSLAAKRFQDQKDALEKSFLDQKDQAAKSFADMVGAPLEEQGRDGEWGKVYKSVHAVFASFEAKYEAVTSSGNESWKDQDLWTAAAKLQKLSASFHMESGRASGLYSLRELEYAAIGLRSAGLSLRA